MKIDELTIGEAKKLVKMFGDNNAPQKVPFEVGKKYLIRTVTYFQVGEVKEICGDFLILKDSSWVADTGRFSDCLKNGTFSEVEPFYGESGVNITAIVDFVEWNHDLPKDQK